MKGLLTTGALLVVAGLLFSSPAAAQDVDADTVVAPTWTTDLTGQLSGSQAGFRNWTEGGVSTLSLSTGLRGEAEHISTRWRQAHQLRLAFGLVKQDTLEFRKAEDVLRLRSSFRYQGNGFYATFNPTVALEVRTQFAPGFSFDKNPLEDGRDPPVKVSDFFSPATFTQTVGLTYNPDGWFTQRLGVASKETVVLIERLRMLYGVDPREATRFELGVESHTELDREVFRNVRYTSSLGLFAAFNQPDLPDMLWENLIAMKVNEWLSVNVEFVALYDRDLSSAIQIKEVFSVGISFVLI